MSTDLSMPVCQIALSTMDIVRTSHWYQRSFDWKPVSEMRENEGEIWAKVPGLPQAHFLVGWLTEQSPFFQFELFQFLKPRMRPQPADLSASDIGYSAIGLHVTDFDEALQRLQCTGGRLLSAPLGDRGERRVCLRDPEGVLLELMEDLPPRAEATSARPSLARARSITLSVRDLDRAHRFWVDALGLTETRGQGLHRPEHEALWGLAGAKRESLLLSSRDFLVEVVQYARPQGRERPAGYLLSDQGILNIALGTTDRATFDQVFLRAERAGFHPCHPPWTLPHIATVVYLQDGQGFTAELLCVEPDALERMGFVVV